MARAAAKSRGRKGGRHAASDASDSEEPILVAAGSEIVGLVLIGLSLLATLALATYAPGDPVGRLVEVSNRAGPVGSTNPQSPRENTPKCSSESSVSGCGSTA